ncbi:MAG: hypothetical protein LBR85_09105 [Oscillospiraceae bacterium]|jgi:hypothetical protein|nr:hypothetical protein [Oscillospiraceae bacterium]
MKTAKRILSHAKSFLADRRGDAGTSWLVGIIIGVVVAGLIIAALNIGIPGWWNIVTEKVEDLLGMGGGTP